MQKLLPQGRDEIVLKPRHSAFFGTPLEALLDDHRIDTLVIAGVSAESCVWMTACDAHTRGFKLVIPADTLTGASAAAVRRTLTSLARSAGSARAITRALHSLSQRPRTLNASAHASPREEVDDRQQHHGAEE